MNLEPRVVGIFRSTRTDHADDEYEGWSRRMDSLVATMPGYLGHSSFRDATTGRGVTISYFESMAQLLAWKNVPQHLEAQALGRSAFYSEYEIEVAEIVRHYQWRSLDSDP